MKCLEYNLLFCILNMLTVIYICYIIRITNISYDEGDDMLLKLDFESDTPIYIQLKRQIIYGIAMGDLKENDSLPSVRQMAEDIGINMHTVNKTYNLLKADGFVTIDRRKGAIISKLPEKPSLDYLESLKEELQYTIAEAICRGMDKEDFLKQCNKLFEMYFGGIKHEK